MFSEFESRVNENQDSARRALENIASIEDMIRNAEDKTAQAREAMRGADTSANLALNVARDAQKISEEASGKAANITAESGTALDQAKELSSSAQSLANKLTDTKEEVKRKEEVAQQDGESAFTVRFRQENIISYQCPTNLSILWYIHSFILLMI